MATPRQNQINGRHGESHKSNYELFNCNNFNIRYWSWTVMTRRVDTRELVTIDQKIICIRISTSILVTYITAAAGTRLALQLFLDKGFKLFSFQLPDLRRPGIVIYCHYLPVSGLGNLRACCLPWMWWPSLRPPLRNQTLISRYPLKPW